MGKYKIKYEDMYSLLWSFKSNMDYLIESVDNYKTALDSYLNTSAMSGQTADAVYNYFQEVHYVFLDSIKQIAQAFLDNFAGYKCGYYSIDASTKFVLAEEGIEATVAKLANICEIFTEEKEKVNSALNDIDNIDGVEHYEHPSDQGIPTSHDTLNTKLTELDTTISDFEATTVTSIDNSIETLMALFIKSLESLFVPSQVEPNAYVVGTFGENPYAAAEIYMNELLQENHDNNVEVLDAIWEQETVWHEQALERETMGVWKAIGGVALIVTGVVCIVATAGAASPFVIGIGATVGTGTALFGSADLIEGGQDIYHGSTGDLDTKSFNYIRDTVFDGNQTAYNITEEIFSFAASAMCPIGKLSNTGSLTLRSGAVVVGQELLSEGAGFGGQYVASQFTDNRTLQMFAGMAASMGTGYGTSMLDRRFDFSGFISPEVKQVIRDHGLSLPEFQKLKLKDVADLTPAEIDLMIDIRNSMPGITSTTPLQKTLPIGDVDKYLGPDGFGDVRGYVARTDDLGGPVRYSDVVETSRLDYTTNTGARPYPDGGNSYGYISFMTDTPENIEIPYGTSFGGTNTDPPPCTLNGFTGARNTRVVPEWQATSPLQIQNGATLHRVVNGHDVVVGVYNNGHFWRIN
ncbi:MAG: LXG domain-containing protein [Ruminococcus sp.]|uniref:T7SS effector LXG polymorphic toxin n=1 Tax=Ruminococcus sp. TaxID=41978 RepID=UPI0025CE71C6|nr:T7SS effector LXG polymorphic toxin [Ruminococcus sp.]MCR5539605.1 LXG domain-containing protein [Ruminococcus sp.]